VLQKLDEDIALGICQGSKRASMASAREYGMLAAECARLARSAPSREARASFAAAARSWLMLARLVGERPEKVALFPKGAGGR
jgi:hypothetical protein